MNFAAFVRLFENLILETKSQPDIINMLNAVTLTIAQAQLKSHSLSLKQAKKCDEKNKDCLCAKVLCPSARKQWQY